MNNMERRVKMALIVPALWAGLAACASADLFEPHPGCDSFLTVQMRGCEVSIYWRCAGMEGKVWQGAYGADGAYAVNIYDREFQWLEGFYIFDRTVERLSDPGKDPISMSTLLESGEDTFGFTLEAVTDGESEMLHVEGRDRLTGDAVEIDGVSLLEADTALTIRSQDGAVEYQSTGRQYVSPDMRLFFLGKEWVTESGEVFEHDNTPVDFIFPGEPGFNGTTPLYECESVLSLAPSHSGGRG